MIHHRMFFRLFLVIYGGFLLVHVWGMRFNSWLLPAGLLGGMAVAIVAHRKHGFAPSVFLVGHMVIEWYHHALHGSHYNGGEITFHGVHVILDMMFLYMEAKEHYAKYALPFLGVVLITLVGIFTYNYVPAPHVVPYVFTPVHHSHGGGALHYAVIGGMLGCVLSHLFLLLRKKHVH